MNKTVTKREPKIIITEEVFLGKFDLVDYIHSKMLDELRKQK